MACTDDDQTMAYLNHADNAIPRLDVTDDFFSERAEILRAQGAGFHFTYPLESIFPHCLGVDDGLASIKVLACKPDAGLIRFFSCAEFTSSSFSLAIGAVAKSHLDDVLDLSIWLSDFEDRTFAVTCLCHQNLTTLSRC